jgi:hypothetical protein
LSVPAFATDYHVSPLGTNNATQGNFSGVGAFRTIQYAINNVPAGNTINIESGNYIEPIIHVNKSMTLQGESRNGVVISPFAKDQWNGGAAAQYGIQIGASNVIIRNLTVNGRGNPSLNQSQNNFREGIKTSNYGFNHLTVEDTNVKNILRRGINIWSYNDHVASFDDTVSNNYIENVVSPYNQLSQGIYAVAMPSSNSTASNNIVNTSVNGIVLWYWMDANNQATITNNVLTNIGFAGTTGDSDWNAGIQFSSPNVDRKITVTNNYVSDVAGTFQVIGYRIYNADNQSIVNNNVANLVNSNYNLGMYIGGCAGTTVQDNSITVIGNGRGIFLGRGASGVPQPNIITGNDIVSSGSSSLRIPEGVGITTTNDMRLDLGFGETLYNVSNSVTNNVIHGFVDGILIYSNSSIGSSIGMSINHNSIYDNSGFNVRSNNASLVFDASDNWWGTNDLSLIQSKLSGNMTYEPYALNSRFTSMSDSPSGMFFVGTTQPLVMLFVVIGLGLFVFHKMREGNMDTQTMIGIALTVIIGLALVMTLGSIA